MKNKYLAILVAFICTAVYTNAQNTSAMQNKLQEIMDVEKAFEKDVQENGAGFAFKKYAAEDAVIKREKDSLIYGPEGIYKYYNKEEYKNAKAYWKPDYINVSKDATMAYTYGKYRWVFTDADGKETEYTGVYHTVWKKRNNTWKYVWD